ncbi:MAG: ABC transporter substrate-binding protein [Planctomycetota bacterium]|jgi:peptide/nickel transport system substrate-binding protein
MINNKREKNDQGILNRKISRRDFLKYSGVGLSTGLSLGVGIYPNLVFASGQLAKEQILKVATISGDIALPMDPMFAYWEAPWLHFIYNGLVRMKPGDEGLDKLESDLATDYSLSDDHTVYTFKLRKGVKFHKGYGECTSEDVLFTFDRLKNDPQSTRKKEYENIDKLEAPDDYTFRVHLKEPNYFYIRTLMAYIASYVVSKKAVLELGEKFKYNPVGTGPFWVKEYRSKDRVVFRRHEEYFRGKPILEQIDWLFMPDLNSRMMALETGAIHMARAVRSGDLVRRLQSKGIICDGYPGQGGWVHFNLFDEKLKDVRIRKALFYATDRKAIAEYYGPVAIPLWGYIPPNFDGAKEYPDRYMYNPEKAKQLLKEAGYPDGFTFSTDSTRDSMRGDVLEILQGQWKKVGVNMDLKVLEHAAYLHKVRKGAMPLMAQPGIKPDMDSFLSTYFYGPSCYKEPTALLNLSCFGKAIPGTDDQIEKARVTFDREKRNALYETVQDKLMDEVPAIPIYNFKDHEARQPYVDLGYDFKVVFNYFYRITENTRILKKD